jgi:predicted RNA-binding Zn ribbon-like protein
VVDFEDDPLRARVLSMVGAVRVADTAQLHAALTPDHASAAYVRQVVMELFDGGVVGRVPRGPAWVWHLTEVGRRAVVEAGAPERRRAATGEAALRSGLAAHALTVTATAIEFGRVRVGPDHGLGGGGGSGWRTPRSMSEPARGRRPRTMLHSILTAMCHRCP